MRKLFIVVPTILVLLILSTSAALAQDPTAGETVWTQQVWQCARCHGPNGEGLWARPLSNSTLTEDEWIAQVRTPRRFMPHFSDTQVSDQQIKDIRAYILTQPAPAADFKPKDPGTATDPGENAMRQGRCIACHEEAIVSASGPTINSFIERGVTPTAESVLKQLRTPFKNMPSYTVAQVPDDAAAPIAAFLAGQLAKAQAAAAPAALPTSGGEGSDTTLPLTILLIGSGLALTGLTLRRLMTKN
ncbi:MAG: cytochrome c [Anaerolineae bacterium]